MLQITQHTRGAQIFQESRPKVKILGVRIPTATKFRSEDCNTVKNVVAWGCLAPGICALHSVTGRDSKLL